MSCCDQDHADSLRVRVRVVADDEVLDVESGIRRVLRVVAPESMSGTGEWMDDSNDRRFPVAFGPGLERASEQGARSDSTIGSFSRFSFAEELPFHNSRCPACAPDAKEIEISKSRKVGVVGAGWAGASVAHRLHEAGVGVEVFERSDRIGGHSRSEILDGVVYEPNGAHIFHTSDSEIASFVQRFGLIRPYEHVVVAEVFLSETDEESVLLSWPPQIDELETLPLWPTIAREIASLPDLPSGDDFESYVISMMGPTLYGLFVQDYTTKQWGRHPSELSSSFAPKRVELRSDGYRRLFRDRWEFFSPTGVNDVIERILSPIAVTLRSEISVSDLDDLSREFDAVVVTAPLDAFLSRTGVLEWRGIEMKSRHIPVSEMDGTITSGYVIAHPSLRVPYTRTIETKHATGQRINATVVSEEYPGSPARHYPVAKPDQRFERQNERLKLELRERSAIPVFFCGRLANYTYINQDEAIRDGFTVASEVLEVLG